MLSNLIIVTIFYLSLGFFITSAKSEIEVGAKLSIMNYHERLETGKRLALQIDDLYIMAMHFQLSFFGQFVQQSCDHFS